jgi:hypothetical protein
MWSHPTRTSAPAGGGYAASLPPQIWELLVHLPARMLAAVPATRCEQSFGDERLAAVAAIYASDDPPDESHRPPSAVLADCAAVGGVLAQRVPAPEAAGYREWIRHISTVGLALAPDDPIGAAQFGLLQEFERALSG